MFSLAVECAFEEKDRLIGELYELGTTGISEEDLPAGRFRLRAFFHDGAGADLLRLRFREHSPRIEIEKPCDWVLVSQAHWEPLLIGERFFLVPPWRDDPAPPGRLRLEMPVGMASGTGLHPATQLALEAMENVLRPDGLVFDLGTGSGILSLAARLLGAGRIVACDIDPEAAKVAGANFKRARMSVGLYAGSTRSVRGGSADLLVANISAAAIAALAMEIRGVLRPGGKAVLTGFPHEDAASVWRALGSHGLTPSSELAKSGWVCLICETGA